MDYPTAVTEKAKRLEQLLQRVAAGEALAEANAAVGFKLTEPQLTQAQAKYEAGGCRREALCDGRYGHAQKVHSGIREWLYHRKASGEAVRGPQLVREIKEKFGVEVKAGHLNYLLRKRGLTAPPGHPAKSDPDSEAGRAGAPVPGESLDNAGLFFPGGGEGGSGHRCHDGSDHPGSAAGL